MHILLGLLSAVGVIVFILWRVKQAADAAGEAADAAKDARGLVRRFFWQRKANRDPIESVSDPREAATLMMLAIAQYDGVITEAELETVREHMMTVYGDLGSGIEEHIAHARWMVKDRRDPEYIFNKLTPLIQKTCNADEKRELIEMLRSVAAHGVEHSDVPNSDIDRLEQKLFR